MEPRRQFGEGWLKACSRNSRSFVAEIVDRRLATATPAFEGTRPTPPAAVARRNGIHYVVGTGVPVALLTHLHFERGYEANLLIRCFSDLTPGRIERALDWAVRNAAQVGIERGWLLGEPIAPRDDSNRATVRA